MGIGASVFLIAAGAVLFWAIDVDLPYIDDDALGLILVLAGIATMIISVIMKANRPEAGVGTGVFLIAAGAVLTWAIDIDVPYISDSALGTILMVAGLIAIVATVGISLQRRQRRNGYTQDPYAPNPYPQAPNAQAPYAQVPPAQAQGPQAGGPRGQASYAQDPYGQTPQTQDPHSHDPNAQGRY